MFTFQKSYKLVNWPNLVVLKRNIYVKSKGVIFHMRQTDSSPVTICMKCKVMFYGENINSLSSAEFVQRAKMVNF